MDLHQLDIIDYIRDEMLTNPNISAEMCYTAAEYSKNEPYLFDLMNSWMETTCDAHKIEIENTILKAVEEIKQYGRPLL